MSAPVKSRRSRHVEADDLWGDDYDQSISVPVDFGDGLFSADDGLGDELGEFVEFDEFEDFDGAWGGGEAQGFDGDLDGAWGGGEAQGFEGDLDGAWGEGAAPDGAWTFDDEPDSTGRGGSAVAPSADTTRRQVPAGGQHAAAAVTPVAKPASRSARRAERRAARAAAKTAAQPAQAAAVASLGGHAATGAAAAAAAGLGLAAGGLGATSGPATPAKTGRITRTRQAGKTRQKAPADATAEAAQARQTPGAEPAVKTRGKAQAGKTPAAAPAGKTPPVVGPGQTAQPRRIARWAPLRRLGQWFSGFRGRRHLYFSDVMTTATLGPRSRPVRAVLSAVGIGIGITALVAVIGVPASVQAQKAADYDAWGANVLQVQPKVDQQTGDTTKIPDTAPAMVARISVVKAVLTVRATPKDTFAYRNDKVSPGETGGLTVWVADGDPVGALNATFVAGGWFSAATVDMPTAVLGRTAADRLGVTVGQRVWAAQSWWAVVGVMDNLPRYSSIYDSGVFLAPGYAPRVFDDLPITVIQVNAYSGQAVAARSVMAATVNPARPSGVDVSNPSDYSHAQAAEMTTLSQLALGLGAVAIIVGGIGIANTMVVAVMERRGEIGLRRALGARTGQIGLQFVLEAAVIGLFGGLIGIGLGAYAVFLYTAYRGMAFAIPLWVILAGPAMAAAVGILAGLYPSLKAARQPPTTALRTV